MPRTREVYPAAACLSSRLAYKVWYVIMLSLNPGLGITTRDKLRVQRGNETLVKLVVSVTRNSGLLDYVMLISILFGNIISRMVMFTGF